MWLWCDCNRLAGLDLTRNVNLVELNPSENPLGELNITKNTKLKFLACDGSNLTKLDVSKNKKLMVLIAHNNNIESTDIGNCNILKKYVLKNDASISDGQAIWFGPWGDEEDFDVIHIDEHTKLLNGSKTLYPA